MCPVLKSSKIHHVIEAPKPTQHASDLDQDSEVEEELSNTKNDKLLHELVHSKLLNNPDAFDVEQGSAKRSRTVAGRLVELADGAKVGQGAVSLKAKEHAQHAKRVRLGLKAKARQREVKALDEVRLMSLVSCQACTNLWRTGESTWELPPLDKEELHILQLGGSQAKTRKGTCAGHRQIPWWCTYFK